MIPALVYALAGALSGVLAGWFNAKERPEPRPLFGSLPALEALSDEQLARVLDALVFAVYVDGVVTPQERAVLDAYVDQVLWAARAADGPQARALLAQAEARVQARLESVQYRQVPAQTRVENAVALVRQVVAELPDPAVRNVLFQVLVSITRAHGIEPELTENLVRLFEREFELRAEGIAG